MIHILQGDCAVVMPTLSASSVDSIVCDPPYELGFMGKGWDSTGIANSVAMWREAFRVLKPGGHLLAFSGTRTYHRMVCAIEDAGFEIRDQIGWLYGSGFPKSLDVSKAIDKAARGVPQGGADPTSANHGKFKGGCSDENPGGRGFGAGPGAFMAEAGAKVDRTLVSEAAEWQGWGTALKPAWEPIVVARKPLIGTVASNVLQHGTGAINVDACRVGSEGGTRLVNMTAGNEGQNLYGKGVNAGAFGEVVEGLGRWPANIIHDGSDEVLAAFPQAPGAFAPVRGTEPSAKTQAILGEFGGRAPSDQRDGGGSAARFFYTAKANGSDRNDGGQRVTGADKNTHPTVKPTDLMRYLCRLVTPPGGTVLDPFMGSGSTLKAAELEGFSAIGIELDPAYIEIARRRIGSDAPLFSEVTS